VPKVPTLDQQEGFSLKMVHPKFQRSFERERGDEGGGIRGRLLRKDFFR
jgi:hypothetical protein